MPRLTRMSRRIPAATAIALALLGTPLRGEEPPADQAAVSLQDCILRAVGKNLGLAAAQYGPKKAAQDLDAARADLDPDLQFSAEASESKNSAASSELEGSDEPTSEEQNLTAKISQKLITGAAVSLSSGLDRSDTDSEFATLNPAYDADITLSVSQPLLRGAGTRVNRASIRKGEIDLSRAGLTLRAKLMDVVRDTELAYWDLAYAQSEKEVRQNSLELSHKLLEQTQAKEGAGLATKVQILQAEAAVATKREAILLAEQRVSDRRDALLALMGETPAPGTPALVAQEPASVDMPKADVTASLETARRHQPEYLSAAEQLEKYRIERDVARNGRLPSLALSGAVGVSGTDESEQDAVDSTLGADGHSWEIGLTLTIPWGLRKEKAEYLKARYELEEAEANFAVRKQDLLVGLRTACRAVTTAAARAEVTEKARRIAEEHYNKEKETFEAGLTRSRDVLDAQTDYDDARMSELGARIEARKALVRLRRLEGSILAAHGLE
ncbi:MAG: TolC family protein [Kiritimatiellae bacterium]|nr:TolC family protein [Kiritimatiellia bacterium]